MIRPIDIKLVISLFYIAIMLFVMLYNTLKEDRFQSIFLLYGALWPLVLWFVLLTSILEGHADRKKFQKVQNKAHFFDTHKGEIHPELRDGVNKEIKRKTKYRRAHPLKTTAKGYVSRK